MSEQMGEKAGLWETLIDRRVEKTGCSRTDAERLLRNTVGSIHAEAGTLPEALWRYKFCRPMDSREYAARLLRETPSVRPEYVDVDALAERQRLTLPPERTETDE
jgi:hypothetical protein